MWVSDFPRSLCFMWFWFCLEILRLVYKKALFKILNGFYLIWPFNFQKNSTVPYKSWKKNFFKMGAKGIKRSGILRWFHKCVELSRKKVLKNFVRKIFFPFCQTRDSCIFFKSAQNSPSFDTLYAQFWRNFFKTPLRGGTTFFGG